MTRRLLAAVLVVAALPAAPAAAEPLAVVDGVSGLVLVDGASQRVLVASPALAAPGAVAAEPGGDLLVATGAVIVRVGRRDGAVTPVVWGPPLVAPVALAWTEAGVAVVDAGARAVMLVDAAGARVLARGAPLCDPRGVAAVGGALVVADTCAGRGGALLRIDPRSGAASVLATGGALCGVRAVAAARSGELVALARSQVVAIGADGAARTLAQGVSNARAIAVAQDGSTLVATSPPPALLTVAPSGALTPLSVGGLLTDPRAIAPAPEPPAQTQPPLAEQPAPGAQQPVDVTAPVLRDVRVRPSRFSAAPGPGPSTSPGARAAAVGATISFTLSEPARVRFFVQERTPLARRCRRARAARHRTCIPWHKRRGSFVAQGVAGANSVAFTGRLARQPLLPNRYRLLARAVDAGGNRSRKPATRFTIVDG